MQLLFKGRQLKFITYHFFTNEKTIKEKLQDYNKKRKFL